MAQAWGVGLLRTPVAAPGTRNGHIDLFGHLSPRQALVTKLQDLIGGGDMSRRTATTHGDAGLAKLLAYHDPGNA
jgi:hypothetical protein